MVVETVLLIVIVTCAITDLANRKIYNWVLLPTLIFALGYHSCTGNMAGWWFSLKGFATGLALLLIPYLMGGIGAGDVKLLAVIGALEGSSFVFINFLAGAMAGGILAVFFLTANKKLLYTLKKLFYLSAGYGLLHNHPADSKNTDKHVTIPYGVAIAIGTVAAYFVR